MKRVYIISQYRANGKDELTFHANVARATARDIAFGGDLPVAPHIYYTQFMDDSNEDERNYGLEAALADLVRCDEFVLVLIDGHISEGMQKELVEVSRLKLPGRIVSLTSKEAKEAIKLGLLL